MHAKYEVSVSYSSTVIAKVKVDNRQTNKQTDWQDKTFNNIYIYVPHNLIKGHNKMQWPYVKTKSVNIYMGTEFPHIPAYEA